MPKIETRMVAGHPVVLLESDALAVQIEPWNGAKVRSLTSKRDGHEYFWQDPRKGTVQAAYGENYLLRDMSGLDECFPTVNEVVYPDGPHKGVAAPDHGSLWGLAWDWEVRGDALWCRARDPRFPFTLEREASFSGPETLRLAYRLTSDGDTALKYIWAGHLIKPLSPSVELIFPSEVDRVMMTTTYSDWLGDPGEEAGWPVATDRAGNRVDLSRDLAPGLGRMLKAYPQRLSEGWCAHYNRSTGHCLKLAFPVERVPYVGLWINQGYPFPESEFSPPIKSYCCAMEAQTARSDDLNPPLDGSALSEIAPGEAVSWHLEITGKVCAREAV